MTKAPNKAESGGFAFKIETGVPMPTKRGGSGSPKYDWSAFPAPKDPNDKTTFASALVPDVKSAKTIHTSIKRYREKLRAEGVKDLPEFSTFKETDAKGNLIGFRVFRTK